MKTPQCNRAFAEMLAAGVERKEHERALQALKEWKRNPPPWEYRDWGEMRFRQQPLRQPRLHQKTVDSAFIVAIFLAACAVILCAVR